MSRMINITKYGGKKKGRKRYMFRDPLRLGVTAVGFVTVLIVCSLALIYLMQANRTATYGFEVEEYDRNIKNLEEERDRLELEAAQLRSTNKIKENLEELNMQEVDPTKIAYYELDKKLAKKDKK